MAEWICRALRDGALDGEHAPALTIKDFIHSAFGFDTFTHVLSSLSSNIVSGKSQARALVLVAFSKSPSYYFDFLKSKIDVAASYKWIGILDCYSDPLGWKYRVTEFSPKATEILCKDVRDLEKLFSSIIEIGKGMVGGSKVHFSVAIDSVSAMLRRSSLSSVAALISNLRSHDQVSCVFGLIHSNLHEAKDTAVLEYMSSMVASVEPMTQSTDGQRTNSKNPFCLEQNSKNGKFYVRIKRRNGRVKVMCEEYQVDQAGIKFIDVSSGNGMVNQNLLPKVQFNLQLSEKELDDRKNVVLPFEHQGNGKAVQIYDGRQSLSVGQNDLTSVSTTEQLRTETDQGKGEIHYFRDSDDEMPDSDEDPDDDLDI